MIFKFAEIFCGPGGLALGAKNASCKVEGIEFQPVWANDIDASTCKTYARNIHNGDESKVYCAPVQELDFDNLEGFDGLSFGFPCNDFSQVGEKKGTDGKFGPLYSYGVKAINAKNPKWFLAENVGGLQSANEGKAFKTILNALQNAGEVGYKLSVHLYKFEEYGVPQKRHRFIIVGIRNDLGLEFRVPKAITPNPEDYVTAKEALSDIPPTATHHELTRQSATVVERLKHIPPGENAWYEGIPEHLQLNVKGARMSQIYRRLHPEKPSYTVTGSGGGGTHGYHWSEPRALTNRERARIQTFPDSYFFEGSKESIRKQIGMAVPPAGVEHIFVALAKTFAGIPYEYIDPKYDEDFLATL
ncbi:DNA cytosine methyltransferase [Vibrio ishigakensis]|nr:DNA cytosine methyltransferase [Vibrio ishigakensis]